VIYAGDQDSVLAPVEKFLRELERPPDLDTVLATALWVEPAGELSTVSLSRLRAIASREAEWFKGRAAAAEETGFLAIFDGPARAIRCACAVARGTAQAGFRIKAALHTGLCEINGDRISGAAPETSRRLAALTGIGDIVVSNSTHDLVSGSGITFRRQDQSELEDIPEVAELFTVNC
jgi:class 3 adenylate cyclase